MESLYVKQKILKGQKQLETITLTSLKTDGPCSRFYNGIKKRHTLFYLTTASIFKIVDISPDI